MFRFERGLRPRNRILGAASGPRVAAEEETHASRPDHRQALSRSRAAGPPRPAGPPLRARRRLSAHRVVLPGVLVTEVLVPGPAPHPASARAPGQLLQARR